MATLRDIKRRIGSVTNTRQITSAMKMVSTAKLARAQNAVRAAQPFSEELRRMVINISKGMTGDDHPLFQVNEQGKTLVVVFTSDRGLCGAFNTALCRTVETALSTGESDSSDSEIIAIGRVGNDYFRNRGYNISKALVHAKGTERTQAIQEIISGITTRFLAGEIKRVVLAYNHFLNPMTQEPRLIDLLPIVPPEEPAGKDAGKDTEEEAPDEREMLFEPSKQKILDVLLPKYLENQCFTALLNTEAGEHGARMVAMDGATRNAGDMINALTLQYNRVRQAAITRELIEIVNGAQAL